MLSIVMYGLGKRKYEGGNVYLFGMLENEDFPGRKEVPNLDFDCDSREELRITNLFGSILISGRAK